MRMRSFAMAVAPLAAALALACSLSTNVDQFDDGACPTGMKACNGMCASEVDPTVGCEAPGCVPCDLANAIATCSQGTCSIKSCVSDAVKDCNRVVGDGCETDLQHDPMNCGDCGCRCGTGDATDCMHGQDVTPIVSGTAGCSMGQCSIGACDPGWGDCDGNVDNGCETATNTDNDCGTCGTSCGAPDHCVCTLQDGSTGCACSGPDAGG
jgi:hypothetical protein